MRLGINGYFESLGSSKLALLLCGLGFSPRSTTWRSKWSQRLLIWLKLILLSNASRRRFPNIRLRSPIRGRMILLLWNPNPRKRRNPLSESVVKEIGLTRRNPPNPAKAARERPKNRQPELCLQQTSRSHQKRSVPPRPKLPSEIDFGDGHFLFVQKRCVRTPCFQNGSRGMFFGSLYWLKACIQCGLLLDCFLDAVGSTSVWIPGWFMNTDVQTKFIVTPGCNSMKQV